MNDVGLTFEKLYVGYISKNVLNSFRQDKGYQAGTYIKDWGGIEDNEYLIRLASKMDPKSENFSSELYTLMEKEYEAHSSKKMRQYLRINAICNQNFRRQLIEDTY